MKFVDVVTITQKALAQAMGEEYMSQLGALDALDSAKLADVGRAVTGSGTVEKYSNALISLLGKFELMNDVYTRKIKSLYVDSFEWGGFIERVLVDVTKIVADPMYDLQDGVSYATLEHTFHKPTVSAKIFEEAKAIMSPISIVTDQLQEAFRSWDELTAYTSGIQMQVRNTIEFALDMYEHMIICCGVAMSCSANSLGNARHLLTEAKALGIVASDVTSEEALRNKTYQSYCMEQIANARDNIREMTTAFNNGDIPIFARETGLVLLSQFKNAVKFGLLANTYNRDELNIGEYDTVGFWQAEVESEAGGSGNYTPFNYNTASTIYLAADANNKLGIGTDAFLQRNVIGMLFDKRALGLCLRKSKVTSTYTGSCDFFTEWNHQLLNYLIDDRFGMVAFLND